MKARTLSIAAGAALLFTACAPKYTLRATEAESPVLPGECPIQLYARAPDEPYRPIGMVEPQNPAKLADSESQFLDAIREQVCKHGGNGVIAEKDETGHYVRGTAIVVR